MSWKICLSLLSLNFLFLTVLLEIVFICVVNIARTGCSGIPKERQKQRVNVHTARASNRGFYEVRSLQFFILLKFEERVCEEK